MATLIQTHSFPILTAKTMQTEVHETDPFHQLVQDLSDALGPSSGLDSEDVDVDQIEQLLRGYESGIADWERYALADYSRPYTRNLVDIGNGKSNLVCRAVRMTCRAPWERLLTILQLILVWTPGKGSPIHDHAGIARNI